MLPRYFYAITTLLSVISIVIMLFCGIIIIKAQHKERISVGVADYITLNLQTAPIQDLTIVSDSICPAGFTLHKVGKWPGTVDGCIIKNKPSKYCNKIEITELPDQDLTEWKSIQFCIKRNVAYSYDKSQTCIPGYKQCNSQLCVSEAESCPITSMSLVDAKTAEADTRYEPFGLNNQYLKIVNKTNAIPIYNLEVAVTALPCYALGWQPSKKDPYPLLRSEFGCGSYGQDFSSEVIDSTSEIALYGQNGLEYVFSKLTGYKDSIKDGLAYLVTRKKIELVEKDGCHKPLTNDVSLADHVRKIEDWRSETMYLLILEALILLSYAVSFYFARKKRTNPKKCLSDWKKILAIDTCLLMGVELILGVALFLHLRTEAFDLTEASKPYVSLGLNNCFKFQALNTACSDLKQFVDTFARPIHQVVNAMSLILIIRLFVMFSAGSIQVWKAWKKRKEMLRAHDPGSFTQTNAISSQPTELREQEPENII